MSSLPGSAAPLLSIVAPCFNEAAGLARFHGALAQVLDKLPEWRVEIILVDDGSADKTLEIMDQLAARDPRVRPLPLARNFGHQAALSAGLDAARGDAIVLMDSDLQHPPELLPRMLALWKDGVEVVATIRTSSPAGWLQRWTSGAFYWLMTRWGEVPIQANAADFCLLSRRVRDHLVAMPERHRLLRGLVAWLGFERAFIEFKAPERAAGRSTFSWRRRLTLGVDGLIGFSTAPLRLVTWSGLLVSGLGGLYLLYVLVQASREGGAVPGWPSLISVVLILGGLQLISTGVLGAYLARLYEQSKGRPLYVLRRPPDDATPR
jgi:polyisoprenyl-phosphate glycosyltransferase